MAPTTHTFTKPHTVSGVGLHSGHMVQVTLLPAPEGHGIVFERTDLPTGQNLFPIVPQAIEPSPLCTKLKNPHGHTLSTVEHLMATLVMLNVLNAKVQVSGPELPILDGSALPWVHAVDAAGRTPQTEVIQPLIIQRPLRIDEGGRILEALPDPRPGLRLAVVVDFPHPAIGRQEWQGLLTEDLFRAEIAPARSFIQEKDLAAAQQAGMIRGASLQSGVLFGEDGTVKNPEGLRFPNEPVRHKVLDALGDFALSGRPVQGRLALTAPGHTANNMLLCKIAQA